MNFDLEAVPAWAHNWCYYFLAVGILTSAVALFAIFERRGNMTVAIGLLITAAIQLATSLTFFWMCRRSLA